MAPANRSSLWLQLHDTGRQLVVAVQLLGTCSAEAQALRAEQHRLVTEIATACGVDR